MLLMPPRLELVQSNDAREVTWGAKGYLSQKTSTSEKEGRARTIKDSEKRRGCRIADRLHE